MTSYEIRDSFGNTIGFGRDDGVRSYLRSVSNTGSTATRTLRRRSGRLRAGTWVRLGRRLLELERRPLGMGKWPLGSAAASRCCLGGGSLGAPRRRLALLSRLLALALARLQ